MYRIEKKFSFPMGHRLSKHSGRCHSIHGHNFIVLIGVKSEQLNENDMVIDFSHLKALASSFLDGFDHCLLLNETDQEIHDQFEKLGMRVMTIKTDPTAERLCKLIYKALQDRFAYDKLDILMDYVTVYENENSKATYSED
jgi:6-pyruvoyltetrahydropterin/6-carboxytetrahydropterin synthase